MAEKHYVTVLSQVPRPMCSTYSGKLPVNFLIIISTI